MRTLNATLDAAMKDGAGIPYVYITIDTGGGITKEVRSYKIKNLEFECVVEDIGSITLNTKITISRGITVSGTLYTISSPTWFIYAYETYQGLTTIKANAFHRTSMVLSANQTINNLLTAILSPQSITASLSAEYPTGITFGPTGSTIYLATKSDILNYIARKFFMSAFARDSATIQFRSMGYAAVQSTGTSYTFPTNAILRRIYGIRTNIVCSWIDENNLRHYNYTPPATKPVHDCGFLPSTVTNQEVSDSSEDNVPVFQYEMRPDWTLEEGDFLYIPTFDISTFITIEEIYQKDKTYQWIQIVRDASWRPTLALTGSTFKNNSGQSASKIVLNTDRFNNILSEEHTSTQSAFEELDDHIHTELSGTYTPTRSAETNMDSNVTMAQCQWMRVGNTVTVSGRFTADPTTAAVATSFEITLPIASNIGAAEDVSGVAFCGGVAGMGAEIIGVAANNTAKVQWISADITSQTWSFTFTYQVI